MLAWADSNTLKGAGVYFLLVHGVDPLFRIVIALAEHGKLSEIVGEMLR